MTERSYKLQETRIEIDTWRLLPRSGYKQSYREAVTNHSPGLPRFAVTLGIKVRKGFNPNGVVAGFLAVFRNRFAVRGESALLNDRGRVN